MRIANTSGSPDIIALHVCCERVCDYTMCAPSDIGTVAASAFVRLNAFQHFTFHRLVSPTACVYVRLRVPRVRTLWSSQCIDTGAAYVIRFGRAAFSILTLIFVSKISHQEHIHIRTHNRYQHVPLPVPVRKGNNKMHVLVQSPHKNSWFELEHWCRAAFVARY